jgi:nicotinamidase-related amidase
MDRLLPGSSLLLVVDVQERLAAAMQKDDVDRTLKNARLLTETAALLNVPIVVTEQYPKGLGPTADPLGARLRELGVVPIDKIDFDAASEPRVARAIEAACPRAVVLFGMETHICVFQTARELTRLGYATYVVGDACASRQTEHHEVGLRLAERAGAVVTVAEAVVFDWVGRAGTQAFRAVSKLVK